MQGIFFLLFNFLNCVFLRSVSNFIHVAVNNDKLLGKIFLSPMSGFMCLLLKFTFSLTSFVWLGIDVFGHYDQSLRMCGPLRLLLCDCSNDMPNSDMPVNQNF